MAFLLKLPFMNGMRYYKLISDTKSTPELLTKLKSDNKNKFMTLYMTIDLLKQTWKLVNIQIVLVQFSKITFVKCYLI